MQRDQNALHRTWSIFFDSFGNTHYYMDISAHNSEHIKISYTTTPLSFPDSEGKPQLQKFEARLPTASMLRVSKAIYAETEKILYHNNVLNSTVVLTQPATCSFSCRLLAGERIGQYNSSYFTSLHGSKQSSTNQH